MFIIIINIYPDGDDRGEPLIRLLLEKAGVSCIFVYVLISNVRIAKCLECFIIIFLLESRS